MVMGGYFRNRKLLKFDNFDPSKIGANLGSRGSTEEFKKSGIIKILF